MKLMRYAEMLMTDGKADPAHNSTVSFGNCMIIRIPGSFNSKHFDYDKGKAVDISPKSEVKITQRWDGNYRPNIRWLLEGHWSYLIQERCLIL
jgi:hypothetical protein